MASPRFLHHQPKKRFGQNFLHDQSVISQIIDRIHCQKDDLMLEIGPGLGAITEPLLTQVEKLTVIEIDTDLADNLRIQIGANSNNNLTIIKANAMEVDYRQLFATIAGSADKKMRIVGNLPYNISTPLLFHLLTFSDVIQDMHFMLQKEVVDRITAQVNCREYGRLSVMMQYFCQTDYLLTVPNGAFHPAPKVTSAVFRLTPYQQKPITANDEKLFALVVREAFNHRRKTLRAIFKKHALLPPISEQNLLDWQINPMARPETLSVADFVKLSNGITDLKLLSEHG
ncbi:16S ribosomal RNA methyltransferase KsgA/Dim1 family protein [Moraxella macacae 0408225]|uniref:Ribosomal RNA small subunit methyltransferase A n=1 Tax=Moraxella macacae 0408225 TaxID=1230338 RepID=L2F647_9GAMM|nr:16S rRNA (adenine(1518)-N(6)/adenine(1519)-N(6))-dimethyltransferase RsmA [Moraxella macacae]ELA08529.1 16S ribosomal RNA methyltransferase KsgA/Dim1 family protein [Moraxella macacae 0408225]